MSGITSTTGLVSGIDSASIIDQLMAIESTTVTSVQNKITTQETIKTAWMALSASILGVQASINTFTDGTAFEVATATSSNESVLTASASTGATRGTFQFTVKQMAQNHQAVSTGYSERDALVGAGEITFDTGRGKLNKQTELSELNGQSGVSRGSIKITDRSGNTEIIDLAKSITVTDVIDTINSSTSVDITASIDGDSIVITDSSGGGGNLIVENFGSASTATDLGIEADVAANSITGTDLVYISEDTAISSLNDGNGLDRSIGTTDLAFTLRDGTTINVNLLGASNQPEQTAWTVGDIIDAINDHDDNTGKLQASISADGNGITLIDSSGGSGDFIIADGDGSSAASQLGIAGTYTAAAAADIEVGGDDIIAGLNTVLISSLNGGNGMTTGQLLLTDRSGASASVDLSGTNTLSEVIEEINNSGVGITASLNSHGTGLVLTDTTGSEDNHMVVSDITGNLAATLGIEVDDDVTEIAGSNANLQYISGNTLLDDITGGAAWDGGKIKITTTAGSSFEVNLSASNVTQISDVLAGINSNGSDYGITARINDSGTGIVIEDSNGGSVGMKVEEVDGGKTAAQLNIKGEAETGVTSIDGSFRQSITLEDGDTLEDLVSKINDANVGISASIFSDQSSAKPYRLMLVSETSGRDGEMVIDTGDIDMSLVTTAQARDAVVFLGSTDGAQPVVVTSSTNEVTDVIEGVTLNITGTDDDPVTISIDRDIESVTSGIESFVSTFNSVISTIDEYTSYNAETEEKGVLFANSNISLIRSKMLNMVIKPLDVENSAYSRLNQVGISLGSGNSLSFDSSKFMEAFEEDADSVIELFTQDAQTETTLDDEGEEVETDISGTGGMGTYFTEVIDSITDEYDGMIVGITDSIDSRMSDLEDRVDYLNDLLDAKRARYETQFANMELAIAEMQSQNSALSSLSSISSTTTS